MSAVSGNALTATFRLVQAFGRRRVLEQLLGCTTRSSHQLAATIRATSREPLLCALGAERALERADPRRVGVAGKIGIAALAVRTQFQHGVSAARELFMASGLRLLHWA